MRRKPATTRRHRRRDGIGAFQPSGSQGYVGTSSQAAKAKVASLSLDPLIVDAVRSRRPPHVLPSFWRNAILGRDRKSTTKVNGEAFHSYVWRTVPKHPLHFAVTRMIRLSTIPKLSHI